MADLKIEKSGEKSELKIGGELNIQFAEDLKKSLIQLLESNDVTINIEKLESIDISCLQLLYSAYRTSVNSNRKLTFNDNIPDTFMTLLSETGFERHFDFAKQK